MLLHELQYEPTNPSEQWLRSTLKSKSGKRVVVQKYKHDDNCFILGYGSSDKLPAYCWVYTDKLDIFTAQALLFAFLDDEVSPEFMARGW